MTSTCSSTIGLTAIRRYKSLGYGIEVRLTTAIDEKDETERLIARLETDQHDSKEKTFGV